MESMDVALRASEFGLKKGKKDKADSPAAREARIQLYSERFASGLDIWTGLPRGSVVSVTRSETVTITKSETVSVAMLDEACAQLEIQQELEEDEDGE